MQEIDSVVSRREFLRPATVGAGTTLGASSVATVQQQQPVVVELKSEPYIFDGATESPLYIKSGATVKFDWVSDGHNIHVDSQPEKATSKGVEKIHDTGFTHTHTFDVNGEYHFWCVPHKPLKMIGDIIVNESGQPPGGGSGDGGGGSVPQVPKSTKTLAIATTTAMGSTLGLAYFFLKYGGDYRDPSGTSSDS